MTSVSNAELLEELTKFRQWYEAAESMKKPNSKKRAPPTAEQLANLAKGRAVRGKGKKAKTPKTPDVSEEEGDGVKEVEVPKVKEKAKKSKTVVEVVEKPPKVEEKVDPPVKVDAPVKVAAPVKSRGPRF
jgi:hypothetical protein